MRAVSGADVFRVMTLRTHADYHAATMSADAFTVSRRHAMFDVTLPRYMPCAMLPRWHAVVALPLPH